MDCHEFARLRFANSRNDKILVILSLWRSIHKIKAYLKFLWIFRFVLTHSAQNDKGLFVILSFRKKAKYPLVKPHLWLFRKSQSLHYLLEIVLFYALIHQKQIHKPPNAKGKPAQQKLNYAKPYVAFVKPIYAKHA